MKLGILIGVTCFAAGVTVAMTVAAFPTRDCYELRVTDRAGDLYVAGAGDDCASAFEGAKFPANWKALTCVKVK